MWRTEPLLLAALLAGCSTGPSAPAGTGGGGGEAPSRLAPCIGRDDHRPVRLAGGHEAMLALMDDGTVYCWGIQYHGQCDPTTYKIGVGITQVRLPCLRDAAIGNVGLGLMEDGGMVAWGSSAWVPAGSGPAGNEASQGVDAVQARLVPIEGARSMASHWDFAAAVGPNGYWWWGTFLGRLRDRPARSSPLPWVAVNGGAAGVCLLDEEGQVWCAGDARAGLLGSDGVDGEELFRIDLPVPSTSVAVDGWTGCALGEDQEVRCWGEAWLGLLGRPTELDEEGQALPDPHPEVIDASGPFVGLTMGPSGACAWRADGELVCWGLDSSRSAGVETWRGPAVVPLERVRSAAIVSQLVCSITFDDELQCIHLGQVGPPSRPPKPWRPEDDG